MTDNSSMVLITALIRPHMEEHVVRALHDLPEFPGFTISHARGQGRGRGRGGAYVSSETDLAYQQFLELRLVCHSGLASETCDRIAAAAWTGRKGDGVVFTTTVGHFARIREAGKRQETRHD